MEMSAPPDLENRITELEVRTAYQERLINELDGVVRELGDALMQTKEILRHTVARLDRALDDGGPVEGEVD